MFDVVVVVVDVIVVVVFVVVFVDVVSIVVIHSRPHLAPGRCLLVVDTCF